MTVVDETNPTITAPAAVTVAANASCQATGVELGTPEAGDNCSVASVTNNAPATFPLGDTDVIWTVTDGAGLTATATQTVTVVDETNPTITAPAAVTVAANAS
ncbi:HYR domain-containing protein, partial [Pontibacter sp. BT731]|uniref:HYR domain-containing protein n=1 Tax=Pontibacter coccineus TaxID=3063328 RepID=UPI0026E35D45